MRFGYGAGVVGILSMLVGCTFAPGGAAAESDQIGTQSSPITIQTRKDLPACNELTASVYAYIEDEKVEVGCLAGAWNSPAEATH